MSANEATPEQTEAQALTEECKRLAGLSSSAANFDAHRALLAAIDRLAALAQPQQAPTQPESEVLTDERRAQIIKDAWLESPETGWERYGERVARAIERAVLSKGGGK